VCELRGVIDDRTMIFQITHDMRNLNEYGDTPCWMLH